MNKKEEWTYVAAYSYAGEHFSIWIKPIRTKDGSIDLKSRVHRTTLEQINTDAKEHGAMYASALKISEDE